MYFNVPGGYKHTHACMHTFLSSILKICMLYMLYASNFLTNIFKWSLHLSKILIIICHSFRTGHEIHRACSLFFILREMGTYLPDVPMRILRCGIFRQRHPHRLHSLRLDWQVSWWVQAVNCDLWHLCPFSWHYWCGPQCLKLDMLLGAAKRVHHSIALPLSLEQHRIAVAAAPKWTSRDAKWELNYSPALRFPAAIIAVWPNYGRAQWPHDATRRGERWPAQGRVYYFSTGASDSCIWWVWR